MVKAQESVTDDVLKTLMFEAFKKSIGPAGDLIGDAHDIVIEPIVTASTTHGTTKDKMDAWLVAMGKVGINAVWPAYGLAVKGGEIVVAGVRGGAEQLLAELQDEQNRAILFGKGSGGFLDRFNNVMADVPFIENTGIKGLTADNLGEKIKTEKELKTQWDFYWRRLKDVAGKGNAEQAQANWPRLLKIWQLQRSAIVLAEMTERLDVEMKKALKARETGGGEKTATTENGSTASSTTTSMAKVSFTGAWTAVGYVYQLSQSGDSFSWTRNNDAYKETASGKFLGPSRVSATWTNTGTTASAVGDVVVDANGRAVRISWSNGVVFLRR